MPTLFELAGGGTIAEHLALQQQEQLQLLAQQRDLESKIKEVSSLGALLITWVNVNAQFNC